MNWISELKKATQKTVFILGSGSSLDYIDPLFFKNQFVIGVNWTYRKFHVNYIVVHHLDVIEQIRNENETLHIIASLYDCCDYSKSKIENKHRNVFVYNHEDQGYMMNNFDPIRKPEKNKILTGGTTMINAIGFAYYLGCRKMILCGNDGGIIDGKTNYNGYYTQDKETEIEHYNQQYGHAVRSHQLITEVVEEMKQYGVYIHSLNPWPDFWMDGKKFENNF